MALLPKCGLADVRAKYRKHCLEPLGNKRLSQERETTGTELDVYDRRRRDGPSSGRQWGGLFPDWAGNLYAVNANNGKKIWSHQLSDHGLTAGTFSRTSPAVVNGVVYIGTQYVSSGQPGGYWRSMRRRTTSNGWSSRIPRTRSP